MNEHYDQLKQDDDGTIPSYRVSLGASSSINDHTLAGISQFVMVFYALLIKRVSQLKF